MKQTDIYAPSNAKLSTNDIPSKSYKIPTQQTPRSLQHSGSDRITIHAPNPNYCSQHLQPAHSALPACTLQPTQTSLLNCIYNDRSPNNTLLFGQHLDKLRHNQHLPRTPARPAPPTPHTPLLQNRNPDTALAPLQNSQLPHQPHKPQTTTASWSPPTNGSFR